MCFCDTGTKQFRFDRKLVHWVPLTWRTANDAGGGPGHVIQQYHAAEWRAGYDPRTPGIDGKELVHIPDRRNRLLDKKRKDASNKLCTTASLIEMHRTNGKGKSAEATLAGWRDRK